MFCWAGGPITDIVEKGGKTGPWAGELWEYIVVSWVFEGGSEGGWVSSDMFREGIREP